MPLLATSPPYAYPTGEGSIADIQAAMKALGQPVPTAAQIAAASPLANPQFMASMGYPVNPVTGAILTTVNTGSTQSAASSLSGSSVFGIPIWMIAVAGIAVFLFMRHKQTQQRSIV